MSTFRDAVSAMTNKEGYFLFGNKPVKATITRINDDLVILKSSDSSAGYTELAVHIDKLILITA